jgi:GNAT superfamily N-acetyltransferase
MAGKFQWCKFSEVNITDSFFDSLKSDYPEFPIWFEKKGLLGECALVFNDEQGVGAFVYLKHEDEEIELVGERLPAVPRMKIGTMYLAERFRGQRLGEGALGVSLWRWQEKQLKEIYVTVFEKHTELINLFKRFGFLCKGKNNRGECVYVKNRDDIDYSDAYKAFPFISSNFNKAGVIPVFDCFHDRLFPYSELKGNNGGEEEETAGNGITKVYVGAPYTSMHYAVGEPVGIYRIFRGSGSKTYKSVITSYCTITRIEVIKNRGNTVVSLSDFIKNAGNKTVFTPSELTKIYNEGSNVVMIEMVYNGFFGNGHNVTHKELSENSLFPAHPYSINYNKEEFIKILEMGDVNVQNVIID